ncbi:hypothetical protein VN97_g6646 [Penicillium thymicola]|uniref:Uncharacterized protein n=1 Tax=Penicillium thymicola TaxID=293382 RepID=A0AAI9TH77_PENTH|nr:hypothetical protein VN97_g6646 [Penicillium thymicola]
MVDGGPASIKEIAVYPCRRGTGIPTSYLVDVYYWLTILIQKTKLAFYARWFRTNTQWPFINVLRQSLEEHIAMI